MDLSARFGVSPSTAQEIFHEWQKIAVWDDIYGASYRSRKTVLSRHSAMLCQLTHLAARHRAQVEDELSGRKGLSPGGHGGLLERQSPHRNGHHALASARDLTILRDSR
jgi:hypothetical protein